MAERKSPNPITRGDWREFSKGEMKEKEFRPVGLSLFHTRTHNVGLCGDGVTPLQTPVT